MRNAGIWWHLVRNAGIWWHLVRNAGIWCGMLGSGGMAHQRRDPRLELLQKSDCAFGAGTLHARESGGGEVLEGNVDVFDHL